MSKTRLEQLADKINATVCAILQGIDQNSPDFGPEDIETLSELSVGRLEQAVTFRRDRPLIATALRVRKAVLEAELAERGLRRVSDLAGFDPQGVDGVTSLRLVDVFFRDGARVPEDPSTRLKNLEHKIASLVQTGLEATGVATPDAVRFATPGLSELQTRSDALMEQLICDDDVPHEVTEMFTRVATAMHIRTVVISAELELRGIPAGFGQSTVDPFDVDDRELWQLDPAGTSGEMRASLAETYFPPDVVGHDLPGLFESPVGYQTAAQWNLA